MLLAIAMLENVPWMDVIPASFAGIIFVSAMIMLISGVWASRDQ